MKLFSRKALAAVATTVALTTAGLSAPAFADENAPTGPAASSELFAGSSTGSAAEDEEGATGDDNLSSDLDAKEIREWVGVFTAVIGALSAAFVFIQRLTN